MRLDIFHRLGAGLPQFYGLVTRPRHEPTYIIVLFERTEGVNRLGVAVHTANYLDFVLADDSGFHVPVFRARVENREQLIAWVRLCITYYAIDIVVVAVRSISVVVGSALEIPKL